MYYAFVCLSIVSILESINDTYEFLLFRPIQSLYQYQAIPKMECINLKHTHGRRSLTIPAIAYYINTLHRQRVITEPTFKNFQSNGFSGETSNFTQNFCAIPVLHKKSWQSLRVSPEIPFDWKFLKVACCPCPSQSSDYQGCL